MSNDITPMTAEPVSLLSPTMRGFSLSERWDGLFDLYTKDDEILVELAPDLQKVEWALLRGHTNYDASSQRISASMFRLLLREFSRMEGRPHDTFGFDHAAREVYADLSETIGSKVLAIFTAHSEEEAQKSAKEACSMFKRALDGMVKSKYPQKARGSGDAIPKEVLAIWTAQGLCHHFRRLPTKSEVRQKLEAIGVTYAAEKSKDVEGKWRDLFGRSGLHDLPN